MKLRPYTVAPNIPQKLSFLQTLARNIWWSWHPEAQALFERINPRLFAEMASNPLRLLSAMSQGQCEELSRDEAFVAQLAKVQAQYEKETQASRHWARPTDPFRCVAYFSLEFGLHESVRLYSGGLGILAGDHLKSASDVDLPIVAVGLLYREGYFTQQIDGEGWQREHYPENETSLMPLSRAVGADGEPVTIAMPLPEGVLHAAVWRLPVGRINLLLLDTNIPENPPALRATTGRLYGGDKVMRLHQEMLLGVGGLRALNALGYTVAVCHLNEGHAAFLSIERIATLMRKTGRDLETAHELVRQTNVFTTHTPVPAGNETFDVALVRPYLEALSADHGGTVSVEQMIAWGKAPFDPDNPELSMTILGLRCAYYSNGVAKLHGIVERAMWQHLWPDFPQDEVPIGHVTNGVHVPTWLSPDIAALLARHAGRSPSSPATLPPSTVDLVIDAIPDEALWRIHEDNRSTLVGIVRERCERHARALNASPEEIAAARAVLDPNALTIGFARRFATYQRATLILRDLHRLEKILTDADRPVQILFAGKAHPADGPGKDLIHAVTEFARNPKIRGRLLFIENYNINLARQLVRGVDIWLNTPRRPQEASGTSGMKACCNGAIHVSTVDGWWYEGYAPENGWAIGDAAPVTNEEANDAMESQDLYNLLETEIIPRFYDRSDGDVPQDWVRMMKASMKMALARFSSHRMVSDYMNGAYVPAMAAWERLGGAATADGAAALIAERRRVAGQWDQIRLGEPTPDRDLSSLHSGDAFAVTVEAYLGWIAPADVTLQLYHGPLNAHGAVTESHALAMELVETKGDGTYLYRQTLPCPATGRFAFSARILPRDGAWRGLMPGHIAWPPT